MLKPNSNSISKPKKTIALKIVHKKQHRQQVRHHHLNNNHNLYRRQVMIHCRIQLSTSMDWMIAH